MKGWSVGPGRLLAAIGTGPGSPEAIVEEEESDEPVMTNTHRHFTCTQLFHFLLTFLVNKVMMMRVCILELPSGHQCVDPLPMYFGTSWRSYQIWRC